MDDSTKIQPRQSWMGLLSKSDFTHLELLFEKLEQVPDYEFIRRPETGMIMLQGRIGGTGSRFNVGEMTLSRCVLRTSEGYTGYGYTQSRKARHVELIALADAMLQNDANFPSLNLQLLIPLKELELEKKQALLSKAAATKVDFFTMVRGEG